jgi:hypothetical protein
MISLYLRAAPDGYNKKTTLVFYEWIYHTSDFLGRETHETAGQVDFPGQENHECDISTKKTHDRVPFSVYHMILNRAF